MELDEPQLLAYEIGSAEAIDRFLLQGRTEPFVAALEGWRRPTLPIGGGDLIAMGLPQGPMVARTLKQVERAWARAGFPGEEDARALAQAAVDQALRAMK